MSKGFNQNAFSKMNPSYEKQLSAVEEKLLEEKLSGKSAKININDFKGVYKEFDIKRDLKKVADRKLKFEKDTDRSQLFEAIFTEQLERFAWLGDAAVVQTSEYDDFFNGADIVVEYDSNEEGEESVKMAIDVTLDVDTNKLMEKIESIDDNLQVGKGVTIRYFESEFDVEEKGRATNVPRVVIALDDYNYQNYLDLINDNVDGKVSNKEMIKEPFQLVVIEEILSQLNEQKNTLKSVTPKYKDLKIYKNIIKLQEIIKVINEEKIKHGDFKKPRAGLDKVVKLASFF